MRDAQPDWLDEQPNVADARVQIVAERIPICGACGGRLQSDDQYRCPYTGCRAWLRAWLRGRLEDENTDATLDHDEDAPDGRAVEDVSL